MNESADLTGGARLGSDDQQRSAQGAIQASGSRVSLQERGGDSGCQGGDDRGNRNPTSVAERTCTDVRAQLNDLLDGSVDAATRARLNRHLEQCNECDALRRTLEQTWHGLADLDPVRAPGGLRERLKQRLKQQPSE